MTLCVEIADSFDGRTLYDAHQPAACRNTPRRHTMSSTRSNIAILDRALAVSAVLVDVQYTYEVQTAITRLHDERSKALAFEMTLLRISEVFDPMRKWSTLTPKQREDFEAGLLVHGEVM